MSKDRSAPLGLLVPRVHRGIQARQDQREKRGSLADQEGRVDLAHLVFLVCLGPLAGLALKDPGAKKVT